MTAGTMATVIGTEDPPVNLWNLRPPITTYTPSLWGDIFYSFTFDNQLQEKYAEAIEELKVYVRNLLVAAKSCRLVVLIDTLERLGLGYHFEAEIEQKLHEIYKDEDEDHDLLNIALRFRLLRQHQYQVSSNVFRKFTDEDNKFIESLAIDVHGLLSLHEASHVRIHEEAVLEEAVAFTTHHLTRVLPELQSPLKDKVKRALDHPLHKSVPIIEIQNFIKIYERDESRDTMLVKIAKLNFKFMQNLYKKELCQLSRWWNGFDLKTKLPFSRDRVVECFLWGVSFHFEPKYSQLRIAVAKSVQMVSTMDDIYDNYGTLEENQLLTDYLERWDVNEMNGLPDFMKIVYRFVMSMYEDYVVDAEAQEKSFVIPYFAEAVKQLARAYNKEQQWIMERQMPPFEEYMENSVITSCIYVMFIALLPAMKSVTRETVDWLLSKPKIVISTAMMGRHLDDLASHERENRDSQLLTVMDCFMKQHGTSRQETLSKFKEMVEDQWKSINEEWVEKTCSAPKEMVELLLNYARMAEIAYKNYEDGYTNPEKNLAPNIAALFVDPI